MKFALAAFPSAYTLPGRPPEAAALDAHKQTHFLLADDLEAFEQAMGLQLTMVSDNKKVGSASTAALLSLWSRTFSYLADVCVSACKASYVSCPPLLRAALDCIAVQRGLVAEGFADYQEWSENAVSVVKEQQALSFDLGRYRAGSVLAEDEPLGTVYRLLTDLTMPHFGATVLQVAPEAGLERMPIGFADQTFHLGWAELTLGWLLLLADAQLQTLMTAEDAISVSEVGREQVEDVRRKISSIQSNSRRCHVEATDGRFVFHNFRRTASGQPRRVML
jgi:hypothetical protein